MEPKILGGRLTVAPLKAEVPKVTFNSACYYRSYCRYHLIIIAK
jgi:hypothetical protein